MMPPLRSADALARLAIDPDDRHAWRVVAERHGLEIRRCSRRILGQAAAADDNVQETLLRVRACAARFRPVGADADGDAAAWIRAIAVGCALHALRAERRRRARERAAATLPTPRPPAAEAHDGPDEAIAAVRAALATLPGRDRSVLTDRWYTGLPYARIGDRLGCDEAIARLRAHRALRRLRRALVGLGVGASHAAPSVATAPSPVPITLAAAAIATPDPLPAPRIVTAAECRAPAVANAPIRFPAALRLATAAAIAAGLIVGMVTGILPSGGSRSGIAAVVDDPTAPRIVLDSVDRVACETGAAGWPRLRWEPRLADWFATSTWLAGDAIDAGLAASVEGLCARRGLASTADPAASVLDARGIVAITAARRGRAILSRPLPTGGFLAYAPSPLALPPGGCVVVVDPLDGHAKALAEIVSSEAADGTRDAAIDQGDAPRHRIGRTSNALLRVIARATDEPVVPGDLLTIPLVDPVMPTPLVVAAR